MTGLSQAEGDEILEILVRACEQSGPQEMPGLLARVSILLGREVGAQTLQIAVDKALGAARLTSDKGQ